MSLKDKTQSLFAEKFGYPATHVIQAPGRVNLIGNIPTITTVSFCLVPLITRRSSAAQSATTAKSA